MSDFTIETDSNAPGWDGGDAPMVRTLIEVEVEFRPCPERLAEMAADEGRVVDEDNPETVLALGEAWLEKATKGLVEEALNVLEDAGNGLQGETGEVTVLTPYLPPAQETLGWEQLPPPIARPDGVVEIGGALVGAGRVEVIDAAEAFAKSWAYYPQGVKLSAEDVEQYVRIALREAAKVRKAAAAADEAAFAAEKVDLLRELVVTPSKDADDDVTPSKDADDAVTPESIAAYLAAKACFHGTRADRLLSMGCVVDGTPWGVPVAVVLGVADGLAWVPTAIDVKKAVAATHSDGYNGATTRLMYQEIIDEGTGGAVILITAARKVGEPAPPAVDPRLALQDAMAALDEAVCRVIPPLGLRAWLEAVEAAMVDMRRAVGGVM